MSANANKSTAEALSPYTRPNTSYGPTDTKTVTKRFEQALRGVLRRINGAIREAIIQDDIFQLQNKSSALAVDEPDEEPFRFRTEQGRIRQFLKWLRTQLNEEFLTVVGPEENPFIRKAYATGIRTATDQLKDDIDIETVDLSELLDRERFDTGLQEIFTRTYENLQSVARDVVTEVRQTLTEGFAKGWNPTKTALKLTDRVDSIGKHRATLIARTETINAHTEGALNRYEQVGERADTTIAVRHVGRLTAQDEDVCRFCRFTASDVFTVEEFRETIVRFQGTVYRLAPPSHPNGRCTVVPELGVEPGELAPLSERVPGTIISRPV